MPSFCDSSLGEYKDGGGREQICVPTQSKSACNQPKVAIIYFVYKVSINAKTVCTSYGSLAHDGTTPSDRDDSQCCDCSNGSHTRFLPVILTEPRVSCSARLVSYLNGVLYCNQILSYRAHHSTNTFKCWRHTKRVTGANRGLLFWPEVGMGYVVSHLFALHIVRYGRSRRSLSNDN